MSEKSPCQDCIWNAKTWYNEGVNQTLADVQKIIDNLHLKDLNCHVYDCDDKEICKLNILLKEIKNMKSQGNKSSNCAVLSDDNEKQNAIHKNPDTKINKKGCGKIYNGITRGKKYTLICGKDYRCKNCRKGEKQNDKRIFQM